MGVKEELISLRDRVEAGSIDDDTEVSQAMNHDSCDVRMMQLELRMKEWTDHRVAESISDLKRDIKDLQDQNRSLLYFMVGNLLLLILTFGGVIFGRMIDLHIGV